MVNGGSEKLKYSGKISPLADQDFNHNNHNKNWIEENQAR